MMKQVSKISTSTTLQTLCVVLTNRSCIDSVIYNVRLLLSVTNMNISL